MALSFLLDSEASIYYLNLKNAYYEFMVIRYEVMVISYYMQYQILSHIKSFQEEKGRKRSGW